MSNVDLKSLIELLSPLGKRSLEAAAGLCVNRGNYDVTVEHLFQTLLAEQDSDLRGILTYFELDPAKVERRLNEVLDGLATGNTGRPVFSPLLIRWLERAWVIASLNLRLAEIRSGAMLLALLENPGRFTTGDHFDLLETIPIHQLQSRLLDIAGTSREGRAERARAVQPQGGGGGGGGSFGSDSEAGGASALERYAINFTQRAREDGIDPVFGRDPEIRQMVDILARRRKNNPILVGEAGVGKTALAEGLALRIVQGDVPDVLQNVELIALDLGLLQAGAGVKGEFENRLKDVIAEVKSSPVPIILFIDEAHTMIGAGGSEGGSDAANLLKPALARGELRTIAATTWSEYKKYFEKDAALSRRFQLVKVEEPDIDGAVTMLRGLRERYEASHGVIIRDDALVAAAELGSRYISGRQHPDKGIDLIDTSAARVRVALTTKPADLEDCERRVARHRRELAVLERDAEQSGVDVRERVAELHEEIAAELEERDRLSELWLREKDAADHVLDVRARLTAFYEAHPEARTWVEKEAVEAPADEEGPGPWDRFLEALPERGRRFLDLLREQGTLTADEAATALGLSAATAMTGITQSLKTHADKHGIELPYQSVKIEDQRAWSWVGHGEEVAEELSDGLFELEKQWAGLRAELRGALDALHEVQGREPLVNVEVTPEVIRRVISDWTGIPLGKLVRDQAAALLGLEKTLKERIKGQDHALGTVAEGVRASKAGLKNPRTPMGVFLFVGPSGVGKTETALGVADVMFGGERFLTTINMSEFQEKHTVSRLIGSPPGYIGFGEGGVLTEAVRQKPYSVVLLDEVEKAHPEVLNLFYQVFDKGMLADGEGRIVDFKDTVLFLTSNLASEQIMQACAGNKQPDVDALVAQIRPVLSNHFKPALLARMTIVPFYPISRHVMTSIVRLKLGHLADRLRESHKMTLDVDSKVVSAIASRCTEAETGARNVDHIISSSLLPRVSRAILEQMAAGPLPERLTIGWTGKEFTFEFGAKVAPAPEN